MDSSKPEIDFEASGAQEWQLPGYGRIASGNRTVPSVTLQTQPQIQAQTQIRGQAPPPLRGITKPEVLVQQPTTPLASAIPSKNSGVSREGFRGKARGGFKARASFLRATATTTSSRLFRDSPAKSKWRNGLAPSDALVLPVHFGSFKHEFSGAARVSAICRKSSGVPGRNEVFEEIGRKTGAYVKPPAYNDQVIHLWGESAQVAAAKEILQKLVAQCNSFSQKKRADWTKISAHSVSKEADAEFKEKRESMVQHLRRAPDSFATFPEQMLFLWPKDGPSLCESLGPQLEALDIIRARFGCPLFVPKDLPGFICAVGNNHDIMKQIAQRIRTLWGEIMAKSNIKSRVYLLEPPSPISMKSKVLIKQDAHIHKAILGGSGLKGSEIGHWESRANLIQTKNNTRLLRTVENSLRGVSFVRGHLRMRVNFGTFVLDKYHIPNDNKHWYSFEEFREMLFHEQTRGRLIPGLKISQNELLERCFNATDLLEPYDTTSTSLKNPELAYSVNFEFLGTDKSMLRLEAEFSRCPGAQEYEITQRRWLRPRASGQIRDKLPPLQIAVTDFGRSDWQLEIKSLEFYEASSIDMALKTFSHSISFRRASTGGDISAKPERKVIFPPSAPVSRFVEKSAIRYRLKGTRYILEIARYDEYSRVHVPALLGQSPMLSTGNISDVPCTSWGASVFDANWDNLLGDHANLAVGHSANYSPALDTFFPPMDSSISTNKSPGFWELIDLVKKVADLLGPTHRLSANAEDAAGEMVFCGLGSPLFNSSALGNGASPNNEVPPSTATISARLLNGDLGTLF